ncbi:MAG TPA: cytochrome c3 family protein [Bacteroidota bacterium]|nr:cytochrome c3 family protein [Bacteroidota bacterium]
MKRRYPAIAIVMAGALLSAVAHRSTAPLSWPENSDAQSLKFSHSFHVKEAGVACTDCHKAASASMKATDNLRSTHDNCSGCHEDQIKSQCSYCHRDTTNIRAAAIPEQTIIFAHATHVALKDVTCATCHPGVDSVEYAGAANMPTMATCNTCHDQRKATNACEACHTSFTNLIPQDHLVADFKKDHKKLTRLGALQASCATCHTQNFCADCHGAAPLEQFGRSALMSEPSPRSSSSTDGPKQMNLQMVHSMNYRFTHGIDAKAKAADCYTCHSAQDFCAKCHTAGDNLAPGERPASHLAPNFTTLGRNSGGGVHADLAKRDIESCMSCHDARGGDPVCITCHIDPDGIKGTHPRTHPGSFMSSEGDGSWHRDAGATCYNCHTDMNAHPGGVAGRGFCGYCHGPK